jgi:excisionase family DNA binding protein
VPRIQPQDPDNFPEIMNTEQVAAMLGIHYQTAQRMARSGLLPSRQIPVRNEYRFFKSEVLQWLHEQMPDEGSGATTEQIEVTD